jgi:hypothetical protein
MDKTRIGDLKKLERDYKKEKRPGVKKIIGDAFNKVKEQSKDSWLKSAREALVRESKKNLENVKQIHEDIRKHESKMGGLGNNTFSLNISEDRYREIFGHD